MANETEIPLPNLQDTDVALRGRRCAPSARRRRPTSNRSSTCRSPSRPSSAMRRCLSAISLKIGPGAVLELDRKVGEAIDILVNNRLVARGEVVLVETGSASP